MPCWYYEKKELRNTPSLNDGIDAACESRYRREGARFILDAGSKLGLRHDTCTTGVVYFHRFYMFHSFKEFHRYLTAACCLFLAGKVEETPKKCKDIIKTCQGLLTQEQFKVFGDDPKEEVMTFERILLQTIKFDLAVEHPYGMLLNYAKLLKGDKEKIQKMVQMAWTFVNDSLCTTLSLQWEPEIVAVSLMYLASRLTKFEVHDYEDKVPGSKLKWWEFFIEDICMDLMEDVCHQVLDLYSSGKPKGEDSPPPTAPSGGTRPASHTHSPAPKRSNPTTPSDGVIQAKIPRVDPSIRPDQQRASQNADANKHSTKQEIKQEPQNISTVMGVEPTIDTYTQYNPYMSRNMYSSSFMSQEGNRNIQSLLDGKPAPQSAQHYAGYQQPPPQGAQYSYPPGQSQQSAYTHAQPGAYSAGQPAAYPPYTAAHTVPQQYAGQEYQQTYAAAGYQSSVPSLMSQPIQQPTHLTPHSQGHQVQSQAQAGAVMSQSYGQTQYTQQQLQYQNSVQYGAGDVTSGAGPTSDVYSQQRQARHGKPYQMDIQQQAQGDVGMPISRVTNRR